MSSHAGFQLSIDDGKSLDQLIKRLEPGRIVRARIVLCLGNNRYLLRIFGYNMISRSEHEFNRFDEVNVEVIATEPRLKLRIAKMRAANSGQNSGTDIII